jgi:polyisoprenoid-binding protein YceI
MKYLITLMLVSFISTASYGATHQLIKEESVLNFTAIIDGKPATAKLTEFDADINFFPEQPDKSTIIGTVSLPMGAIISEYDGLVEKVTGDMWLNTDVYDKAKLEIKALERKTGNLYTGYGYLTLVGQTLPTKATLFIVEDNKKGQVVATLVIEVNRLAYNIGKGEWNDTSKIQGTVIVNGRFVTKPL